MFPRFILGVCIVATATGQGPQNVNICDLISLAGELDGKLVRVRGIVRNSGSSSDPYFDELIPETCSTAEGRRTVIHIVSPDTHFLAHRPRGYRPDMNSVHRAESVFEKAAREGHSVSATVEGVFQSSTPKTSSASPRHREYAGTEAARTQ